MRLDGRDRTITLWDVGVGGWVAEERKVRPSFQRGRENAAGCVCAVCQEMGGAGRRGRGKRGVRPGARVPRAEEQSDDGGGDDWRVERKRCQRGSILSKRQRAAHERLDAASKVEGVKQLLSNCLFGAGARFLGRTEKPV